MPLKKRRPKKIEKETTRRSKPRNQGLHSLYSKPLPSSRTGALYNAFSYPTKISPEAIAIYIATHTKPGDLVLDTFAGSGTTGLGALLCDCPSEKMIKMADELGVKPKWGPRNAVLYELGVLGAFISETLCGRPNPDAFELEAEKLIRKAEEFIGDIYKTKDPDGKIGTIRHIIWSDVFLCPECKKQSLFSDVAVKRNPIRFIDKFKCPHCSKTLTKDQVKRVVEKVHDPLLGYEITRKKRKPAIVYGKTDGKNWCRKANSGDEKLLKKIEQLAIPKSIPIEEVEWGDLRRNGYHTGITHIHHFYTRRNLLVIATLWEAAKKSRKDIRNALRLLILSYNATHSTLMTRVVAKKNQKDFVLTGAQSGVLYISSMPVEKNIFLGLRRKVKVIRDALMAVRDSNSNVEVINSSSTKLNLPDNSVNYVFTDPPFGDYIPYAELNQINEAWLGATTERKEEIIVSPAQKKNINAYGVLMASVFAEVARVLKNKSNVTVVFHSAKAAVWRALTDAYTNAGFEVKSSSVLDKVQESFKQVVSTVSVKGDPLLLLGKKPNGAAEPQDLPERNDCILSEVLEQILIEGDGSKERTAERLYSRYVSQCLEEGISVSMNADLFYERVRAVEGIR